MNKYEFNLINDRLSVLMKQPLCYVNRGGGSIFIGFGDLVEKNSACFTKDGRATIRKTMVSKYALHIECSVRFVCGNKVILAKRDLYMPNSEIESQSDLDWTSFEWDVKGNNKFDEISNINFSESANEFIVKKVKINRLGDLKIVFENDLILEVFTDISGSEECWRFFEVGSEKHIVVSGQGLENDVCEDS